MLSEGACTPLLHLCVAHSCSHAVHRRYTLDITESHQSTKADTSGTAKAMVGHFKAMGPKFEVEDIKLIREVEEQKAFGVPEEFLLGSTTCHST